MSKCRYDLLADCNSNDCLSCVLDKIRAEIEEIETYDGLYIDRAYVLQIIDKYKAESQCLINRRKFFEGNGYCYMFKPPESEEEK